MISSRINYQHLLYFHVVARAGGLKRGAAELGLSHSTLSTQIRSLERSLGAPLFDRVGRSLELTDAGRLAQRYAEEIFDLGSELAGALTGTIARGARLYVGFVDTVPRLLVQRFLEAVLAMSPPPRIVCRSDQLEQMLSSLALNTLDVIIADAPVPTALGIRAFAHPLGESGVTFLAARSLAERLLGGRSIEEAFPACLDGAPLLVPPSTAAVRRLLDPWLQRQGLAPRVLAEIEDISLVKSLGTSGLGVFLTPSFVEAEICDRYDVLPIGRTDDVRERFFAISSERRIKHPATLALMRARFDLFAAA